jgi:hypothetical protein
MSSFNFSDITIAGAYAQATKAAQQSDNSNAEPHLEKGESHRVRKSLWTLVRRIAAAVADRRPAASQLTSRPV